MVNEIVVVLLKEGRSVTEYIYYGLGILVADLGILGKVVGVELNVLNEVDKEFKGELEPILCHLNQEISLRDNAQVLTILIGVQKCTTDCIQVAVVDFVLSQVFTT